MEKTQRTGGQKVQAAYLLKKVLRSFYIIILITFHPLTVGGSRSRGPTAPPYLLIMFPEEISSLSITPRDRHVSPSRKWWPCPGKWAPPNQRDVRHSGKYQTRSFCPPPWILKQTQERGLLESEPKGCHICPGERGAWAHTHRRTMKPLKVLWKSSAFPSHHSTPGNLGKQDSQVLN